MVVEIAIITAAGHYGREESFNAPGRKLNALYRFCAKMATGYTISAVGVWASAKLLVTRADHNPLLVGQSGKPDWVCQGLPWADQRWLAALSNEGQLSASDPTMIRKRTCLTSTLPYIRTAWRYGVVQVALTYGLQARHASGVLSAQCWMSWHKLPKPAQLKNHHPRVMSSADAMAHLISVRAIATDDTEALRIITYREIRQRWWFDVNQRVI